MAYEKELEAALEAARQASAGILRLYASFQAIADAPADISTEADRQSQAVILAHLHQRFPGDAFCAEETSLDNAPNAGPRLWVIDPIDGSRGFARKNGEFSVMVGFVDGGRVAAGVVLEPALGRLTYAVRGRGCWRRDGSAGEAVRCYASSIADLSKATLIQSRSHKDGPPSPELQSLKPAKVVGAYSAGLKLARVARGEVDIYLNTYPAFHDWDACAGHILVDEAGGRVTGLAGQELMYHGGAARQTVGLLATSGRLHEPALAGLRGIRRRI